MATKRSKQTRLTYAERARQTIAKWIATRGLNQADVAEALDPPRNQVWLSRYLRREYDADVDTLHQLAKIFGNSYDDLFGAEPMNGDERSDLPRKAALKRDLDAAWAAIDDEHCELLTKLAQSFARPMFAPRRGTASSRRSE